MFYGLNSPPSIPQGTRVIREKIIKCSDAGRCIGQLPRKVNGVMVSKFAYLPHDLKWDNYADAIRDHAIYDDGIEVVKCTAIIAGDTLCWVEDNEA